MTTNIYWALPYYVQGSLPSTLWSSTLIFIKLCEVCARYCYLLPLCRWGNWGTAQDHAVSRARIWTRSLIVEHPLLNHSAFWPMSGPAAFIYRQKTNPERVNDLSRIENCRLRAERGPNPDEKSGTARVTSGILSLLESAYFKGWVPARVSIDLFVERQIWS